jgi:hypothetical protein
MFNQYISGPAGLLQVINALPNAESFNEHMLVVHLDKVDNTIKHLSVVSDAYEAESIANTLNENVIVIRGVDREPWFIYETDNAFEYANKLIDNINNPVLDIIVANFVDNTYLSDMCDNTNCCDPDNKSSFFPADDHVGIPSLAELLNN